MSMGKNVAENLRQYSGLSYAFWLFYPQYGLPLGFTPSHVAWLLVVLVGVLLGAFRPLLFGISAYLMFLAPVLLTSEHTHSVHFYLPALGVVFLLASAVDAARRMIGARWHRVVDASAVAAAIIVAAGSVSALHRNVVATLSAEINLPRSFVLRRAVLAQRICDGVQDRWTASGRGRLVMVYPGRQHAANWRNVMTAVGGGSALRILLRDPDLDVVFVPPAPMPGPDEFGEFIVFSEVGDCYTIDEYKELARRRGLLQESTDPGDEGAGE
jgi:hypothetical protein